MNRGVTWVGIEHLCWWKRHLSWGHVCVTWYYTAARSYRSSESTTWFHSDFCHSLSPCTVDIGVQGNLLASKILQNKSGGRDCRLPSLSVNCLTQSLTNDRSYVKIKNEWTRRRWGFAGDWRVVLSGMSAGTCYFPASRSLSDFCMVIFRRCTYRRIDRWLRHTRKYRERFL
jgi:hypothetical protein